MKPSPTTDHSMGAWIRLRQAWRAMVRALLAAWPAPDPPCCHGYGHAYCPDKECYNFDRGAR